MIRILAESAPTGDGSLFLRWIASSEPEPVQVAALDALQQFDSPSVAASLLREYARFSPALRSKVRTGLLSRKASARALLEHVDAGSMSPKEIPEAEIRTVEQFADQHLDTLVRKHWGKVNATPGDKLAVVRRFNNDLSTVRDKPPGVAQRGHEIYQQLCAACHRLHGEGGNIGPDLTAANRRDKEFLLVSLVDPSAVIRKEYLNYSIKTKDGRVLNGFIAEDSGAALTIADAANQRTILARDQIASMEDSGVSLMPEGLVNALTPQQLRDLFAYLQSEPATPTAPKRTD
jgi:putative heme-binding domain-containing protein